MDLEGYMRERSLTDESMAELVGVSRPHITRLRTRKRSASLHLALKIQELTEGLVSAASLSSLDRETPPAAPEAQP